jgi:four helix bundle protein
MTTRTSVSAKPYERFKAWEACHQLVQDVFRLTAKWPKDERFGLTAQARRAAVSAAANIREGSARRGSQEFRRFLDLSLGSLTELTYLLRLGADLKFSSPEEHTEIEILRDHASRLTWGLYSAVAKRAATT